MNKLKNKEIEFENIIYNEIQDLYNKYNNKDISKEKSELLLRKLDLLNTKKLDTYNELLLLNITKTINKQNQIMLYTFLSFAMLILFLKPIISYSIIYFLALITFNISFVCTKIDKTKEESNERIKKYQKMNNDGTTISKLLKEELLSKDNIIINDNAKEYISNYINLGISNIDKLDKDTLKRIREIIKNDYNLEDNDINLLLKKQKESIEKENLEIKQLKLTLED